MTEKFWSFGNFKFLIVVLHYSFYLAETKEKDVKLFFEHLGFEWLPFELALERLTFDNAKEVFKKANDLFSQNLT